MSNILLLMAGVSGDGQAIAWKPQDDVPEGVILLQHVLTPGSEVPILMRVRDNSRDRRLALEEVSGRVLSSPRLRKLSEGEVPLLLDPQTTGFSIVECQATHRVFEFGVGVALLGAPGTPDNMLPLAFDFERAQRAAWQLTNEKSGPIEELLCSWDPGCRIAGTHYNFNSVFELLVVGLQARTLETGRS